MAGAAFSTGENFFRVIETLKKSTRLQKKRFLMPLFVACVIALLSACSGSPLYPAVTTSTESSAAASAAAEGSAVSEAARQQLLAASTQYRQSQYASALAQYEAIVAQQHDVLSDAYALWGVIILRLDRENPAYDRRAAEAAAHVLQQRLESIPSSGAGGESSLLLSAAQLLLEADIAKDQVVLENRRLREELAQHEEALKRLRELTLGR